MASHHVKIEIKNGLLLMGITELKNAGTSDVTFFSNM